MTVLTIRTDETIKKALQEKAKQLGLSLNQFINLSFRYILKSNKLVIDLENEDIRWNEDIEKAYNEAIKELEKEEVYSFDDFKYLLKQRWLMK